MHRKRVHPPRIRNRAKAKQAMEEKEVFFNDQTVYGLRLNQYITEGEIDLKKVKEKVADKNDIAHLYQRLDAIKKCLNEMENHSPAHTCHIIAMPAREMTDLLDMLKKVRLFLADIYEMKSLLGISHLVDGEPVSFFARIVEAWNHMSSILQMMMPRIRYQSLDDPKHYDYSASDQVRPHLLEAVFFNQYLQYVYYDIYSQRSDLNHSHLSQIKEQIQNRNALIDTEMKLLKGNTREYRAYQLALKAAWEIFGEAGNLANAREYYGEILPLLKDHHSVTLGGLNNVLAAICSSISRDCSDDGFGKAVKKRYWKTQELKWCTSRVSHDRFLRELDEINSRITFYYYNSLLKSKEYSKCEAYIQVEYDKEGIKFVPANDTTAEDFSRLMSMLNEAGIHFVEKNDREIIYDCVNHCVYPWKIGSTLTQFVEQLKASRLLDDHCESLENKTQEAEVNLSGEKEIDEKEIDEKEKEKEKGEEKEDLKQKKWLNHLANEAKRAFLKSQDTKLEITTSHEKEEEGEDDKDEPYVLKGSLPGKRIAYYHLSVDEKLAKKIPNEVLENADRIIKEPKRSSGKQGIIFFKNGKGENRKVNAKLKMGGSENIRLFATVEKMYKDKDGHKHFSVNFDHPEMKHRK